jgi:NAD(P)-dependent dehydrogenase (short-subunit alcohol dehydrogenase family)
MNRGLLLAALGVGGLVAYRALKPRYDFRGKHVLITGGSRGLGLVLARQLADAGARLSICSRDPDELPRAVSDLTERGIGTASVRGRDSRGTLPDFATTLSDRASAANNELHAAAVPPPLPAS